MIMDDYAIETAAMLCHAVDQAGHGDLDAHGTTWDDDTNEERVKYIDIVKQYVGREDVEHDGVHVAIIKTLMDRG